MGVWGNSELCLAWGEIGKIDTYYGDEDLPFPVFLRVNFVNPEVELRQSIALPRAFQGGRVVTVLSYDSEVFFRFFQGGVLFFPWAYVWLGAWEN